MISEEAIAQHAALSGAVKVKPLVWQHEARNGWKLGIAWTIGFHIVRRAAEIEKDTK